MAVICFLVVPCILGIGVCWSEIHQQILSTLYVFSLSSSFSIFILVKKKILRQSSRATHKNNCQLHTNYRKSWICYCRLIIIPKNSHLLHLFHQPLYCLFYHPQVHVHDLKRVLHHLKMILNQLKRIYSLSKRRERQSTKTRKEYWCNPIFSAWGTNTKLHSQRQTRKRGRFFQNLSGLKTFVRVVMLVF